MLWTGTNQYCTLSSPLPPSSRSFRENVDWSRSDSLQTGAALLQIVFKLRLYKDTKIAFIGFCKYVMAGYPDLDKIPYYVARDLGT